MAKETAQIGGSADARGSLWSVLGWAAYLACSWTWCIGMFLPVLLVRDYGVWGFVVFAAPNVVGAGAMGWVLRKGASERIVEKHRAACAAFSLVTIAFHGFWLPWVLSSGLPSTGPVPGIVLAACGVVIIVVAVLSLLSALRALFTSAFAVWCLSAFAALFFLVVRRHFEVEGAPTYLALPLPARDESGLLWLGPVCVFGFALCPYLDLTFHRARQATSEDESRGAFTIGFGFLFVAMILFTLAYAPNVLSGYAYAVLAIANLGVVLHFIAQAMFTVTAHAQHVRMIGWKRLTIAVMGILAVAIGFIAALATIDNSRAILHGSNALSCGEIVYRCFMSFYGLVFPAYVWLCMIPTADGHSGIGGVRGRWKVVVLGVACALAAPCYWMGFIERVEWWLAPGLGIVLVARLLVRRSPWSAASSTPN